MGHVFPDTLKHPLERLLTASLGQEVRIEGPLAVHPGRITSVELRGLHIAAPQWARADDLLAVGRLRLGVDVWAYVRHRAIRSPSWSSIPHLALERNQERQTSWPSGGSAAKGRNRPRLSVGRIELGDREIQRSTPPPASTLRPCGSQPRDAAAEAGWDGKTVPIRCRSVCMSARSRGW